VGLNADMDLSTPPLDSVVQIIEALRNRGAEVSIVGSGLVASLGLIDQVRDWDVTTDAADDVVMDALVSVGLGFVDSTTCDDLFATRRRFVVDVGSHSIDVIVGFALWDNGELVELPARTIGTWRGLPMADPKVWQRAYELLGRHDRARLLARWHDQQQELGNETPNE